MFLKVSLSVAQTSTGCLIGYSFIGLKVSEFTLGLHVTRNEIYSEFSQLTLLILKYLLGLKMEVQENGRKIRRINLVK